MAAALTRCLSRAALRGAAAVTLSVALWLSSTASAQTTAAPAPPPKPAAGPDLKAALRLAQAALDACKSRGFAVSVSVVDSAGQAKVTLAADGSPGRTLTAVRKGATAVHYKTSGAQLELHAQSDPQLASEIAANQDLNDHGGSSPLWSNGQVLGGIGISGAKSHDDDQWCAQTAVDHSSFKSH